MFFHSHAHSNNSVVDGMSNINDIAYKAHLLGQPALAITDHGVMSGSVALYKACKKYGMKPLPGIEMYIVDPDLAEDYNKSNQRYHLCVLARNYRGYEGLSKLVTLTHTRPRFHRFPRALFDDLIEFGAEYGNDVMVSTACFFGLPVQRLIHRGPEAMEASITAFASIFPHMFVEVQNHNTEDANGAEYTDQQIVDELVTVADKRGLPVIVTQDSHYLDQCMRPAHDMMKKIVYAGEDDSFPGDGYHFASGEWMREHHTPEVWAKSEQGLQHMYDLSEMTFPLIDDYKFHITEIRKDAFEYLTQISKAALEEYLADKKLGPKKIKAYRERLDQELDIIKRVNMANYFLLVQEVVQWCIDNEICVESRGSANSSLVTFLLKITQVDPVIWCIEVFRFISVARLTPPDIDLDIQDDKRHDVLEYLSERFDTCIIGTYSALGITVDDDGNEKGSILVNYLSYLRRHSERRARHIVDTQGGKKSQVPILAKEIFNENYGHIKSLADVRDSNKDHYNALVQIQQMGSVRKSRGVHAAGILLGTKDVDIASTVPSMLIASSGTAATQYDMDTLDALGLLKLDILGQNSLRMMKICCELAGIENPNDFSWIPMDDPVACKFMRSGVVNNGVFHFTSPYKARGAKEFQIRNTYDTAICTAAYMPGCVDSGQKDRLVEARRNPAKRKQNIQAAYDLHQVVGDALKDTNGIVVFQEQPLAILRDLGMGDADVQRMYKVVKDSGKGSEERNKERLVEIRKLFDDVATKAGVNDIKAVWELVTGYMSYGFNKCIVGDTVLIRSSGNQYTGREITVKEFYDTYNSDTSTGEKYRYKGLYVLAHSNGRIKHDKIIGVSKNGKKDVYTITVDTGDSITATANHRHLTRRGWLCVDEITEHDELATIGAYEKFANSQCTHKTPCIKNGLKDIRNTVRERKNCAFCGHSDGRMEIAHLDHDRTNNDIANLELLCNSCYKTYDYKTGRRVKRQEKGRSIVWSKVTRIEYAGTQETYDITMEGDDHSFVGNNIVTHNSHAVGYGIRSYRTAYLAEHYPLEFCTALLIATDGKKVKIRGKDEDAGRIYQREVQRRGFKILPVVVNKSHASWSISREERGVRKGLTTIKGIGQAAANKIVDNMPYTSITDLCERSVISGSKPYLKDGSYTGALAALKEAGALSELED